jgi:hypothetical protein
VEAPAAIAVIEADLRHVVRLIFASGLGASWPTAVFDEETLKQLARRRYEEGKRRAPAIVPEDLTAYTHLYELRKVIEKRWELFAPALGAKREFSVLLDLVEDYRNAPAHSRELLPYERALLEGIAGRIRTQVTRHASATDPDAMHYPVIEWIRDSFGNEAQDLNLSVGDQNVRTGLRLQVGDTVRFDARGWDPQGRELTWRWGPIFASRGPSVVGTEVSFDWTATEAEVSAGTFVEIELLSSGPYHRRGSYDQRVTFDYTVEPPSLT